MGQHYPQLHADIASARVACAEVIDRLTPDELRDAAEQRSTRHMNLPANVEAWASNLETLSAARLYREIRYLWQQYERQIGFSDPLSIENRELAYALCKRACEVRDRRFPQQLLFGKGR